MARIVILGAGVAGHTAAMHLRRWLGRAHEVVVVSPNSAWNWIPSNIWVGVGRMRPDQVVFPLAPVYARAGIEFHQALATELHPEGGPGHARPYVVARPTGTAAAGASATPRSTVPSASAATPAGDAPSEADAAVEVIEYDYLVDCTGPRLNFAATPGLGPDGGNSLSVCTASHASQAASALRSAIERLQAGEHLRFVIGTGHGTCTCEGAAFEYTFNVDHELRQAGVRECAEIVYFTNESALGDFGVGGLVFTERGYQTSSQLWTESLFRERGIQAITGAHATAVEPGLLRYEQLDGSSHDLPFDFAMLLPPFRGAELSAYDAAGRDISARLFNAAGFLKVDADYTPRPYEEWSAADWPSTYQNPDYPSLFAAGIAFAPPHAISRPRTSPQGTPISPAPPRTGMPSGMMAKAVAATIADRVRGRAGKPPHEAPMTRMGAACVASSGMGLLHGSAAAMTMYPVVPDPSRFPVGGRDQRGTSGEIGLAGHWIKLMLHILFLWKAKGRPLWWLIPE